MATPETKIFENTAAIAHDLAMVIGKGVAAKAGNDWFTISLPGGSTPAAIFRHLVAQHKTSVNWRKVRFFFGDERCVSPDHNESNFRMAHENLFLPLGIADEQVFRVMGEYEPHKAVIHYQGVLKEHVEEENSYPAFDLMLLGMGDDGHTASLFPHDEKTLASVNTCELALHPITGQKRVTLTLPVLNNSRRVCFLVTGQAKATMLKRIINGDNATSFPTYHVRPNYGTFTWYLDQGAASLI